MVFSRVRIVCLLAVSLLVSACMQTDNFAPVSQPSQSGAQTQNASMPDALDPNDPMVAHMLARQQVDPNRLSKRNAYVHYTDEYPQYQGKKELRATYVAPPPLPPVLPQRKADVVTPQHKPAYVSKIAFSPAAPVKPVVRSPAVQSSLTVTSLDLRPRGAAIEGVRFGEHPGKTRIVVDVSERVPFRAWMQDENHVLVMQVADSHVATERGRVLQNHPLVRAYGFRQGENGGQEFIVTFKKPVQLDYKATLPPNSTYQNFRIVLDLSA